MLVIGFGGSSPNMTPEQEAEWLETLALKMQQALEEHGWYSSFGRDPVVILIETQDGECNE